MLYNLKTRCTALNTRVVLEDYTYRDITIPTGFETNGEDSPIWAWSLGFPPFKPKYEPAYMMHDYILDPENTGQAVLANVDLANEYWEELMLIVEDTFKVRCAIICTKLYWEYRKIKGTKWQ